MFGLKKHKQMIENYICNNPKILGAFYGGSIARNDSDKYSDIDLRILVNEKSDKTDLLLKFINLFDDKLFIETQTDDLAVFHLRNFLKIDILIFYPKDLSPNIWLNNIYIIKDKIGFLKYIKSNSENIVTVTSERINFACNKYLSYLIESYKRDKRDEIHYLNYSINMMTNIICHLWYLKLGEEPNTIGDWSKYEGNRSKLKNKEIQILTDILYKDHFEQRNILNKEFLKVLHDIDNQHNINSFKENKYIVELIINRL